MRAISTEPNYDHLLVLGVTPEKAPDEGEYVTMTFEKGIPTSINGEKMKASDIIRKLNELGGTVVKLARDSLYKEYGEVVPALMILPLYNLNFTSPVTCFCVALGKCNLEKMKSNTAKLMGSTFHFPLITATAVTAIYGISVMKD